jgi:hypothetical protein
VGTIYCRGINKQIQLVNPFFVLSWWNFIFFSSLIFVLHLMSDPRLKSWKNFSLPRHNLGQTGLAMGHIASGV